MTLTNTHTLTHTIFDMTVECIYVSLTVYFCFSFYPKSLNLAVYCTHTGSKMYFAYVGSSTLHTNISALFSALQKSSIHFDYVCVSFRRWRTCLWSSLRFCTWEICASPPLQTLTLRLCLTYSCWIEVSEAALWWGQQRAVLSVGNLRKGERARGKVGGWLRSKNCHTSPWVVYISFTVV